jgi:uncharacterized protein (DUF486 family)
MGKSLYYSIIVYIITLGILITIKPDIMFDESTGQMKSFGCNENETIITVPVVSISIALFVYILMTAGNALSKNVTKINKNITSTNSEIFNKAKLRKRRIKNKKYDVIWN